MTDKSCLPDGAVQELTPVELDGKPGECVDDAFGYLVGTTNRTCAQLPTQMNMLGQWAQGQSLHALDGEHKTFGCDSPVATFLRLLDQSGERSCFDRDEVLQLDSCPGEKCTADCAAVVAEGKCSEEFGEVVDVDILPSFGNYCPVACGLCNPPPFETGVTQTVKADDPCVCTSNSSLWRYLNEGAPCAGRTRSTTARTSSTTPTPGSPRSEARTPPPARAPAGPSPSIPPRR